MARIPPLAIVPPVIFAAIAGLFMGGMFRDDPDALPSTLVGQPATVLNAPGAKIVNYWASWCAPCRVEHPQLMELAGEGVPIFGVNYKDDEAKALAFLDELGDPYEAVGADRAGRTAIEWGVYGVPETFVIDSGGRVVLRFAGPVTRDILDKRIRPALAGASGE